MVKNELELELEPSLRIWENNIKLNEKTLVQRSVRSTTYYLYKINFNPYQRQLEFTELSLKERILFVQNIRVPIIIVI